MRLSFIGMSNIGKTFWAKKLAADGTRSHIDCDSRIESMLGDELTQLGYHGINDVAKWMGQPYDPQYQRTSSRYIACEERVTREALNEISANPDRDFIIDTTGSVIYMNPFLQDDLRAATRVIYLEASESHIADLFKRYVSNPKPVIWGDVFRPQPDESSEEALKRCYPELMRDRMRRYARLAHITIPYDKHMDYQGDFIELIREMSLA